MVVSPSTPEHSPEAPPPPSAARLWLFRLLALTLLPALLLLLVEGGLRLAGVGENPSFLVPVEGRDDLWTTNPRYGWRFFPRALARSPVPLEIPADKGETYRIFVVGGSAARGTPDSAYSFGRVLEVLLKARYPDARFEVFNAAMTAINSHVVRDIVRACARHEPDLFVVYLGNNEVVGPFGAGTVFGRSSSRLAAIRASISLRSTRLGQVLGSAVGTSKRGGEWRGMEMFLEQRVAAHDPRLERVYTHFESNLQDIVSVARHADADVLLTTVATNLRDQPPFASLHRDDWSSADASSWSAALAAGEAAQSADDSETALEQWQKAAALDDQHAEMQFRIGQELLALGRGREALDALIRARDLDALRFRADSRINETLRRVAQQREVGLVDAARLFAEGGDDHPALPGNHLFYEHVHLSFAGNIVLARAVATHLEQDLDPTLGPPQETLPSDSELAERLALTPFDREELARDVLNITTRPPFVAQLGHAAAQAQRRQELAGLRRSLDDDAWQDAQTLYRQRLEHDPDDLELRRRFATLLQARNPQEAAEQWRMLVDRLPHVVHWRSALATALSDAGRGQEALAELDVLDQSEGESAGLWVNRGTVLEALDQVDGARDAYRQALELEPDHKLATFNLATVELRSGDSATAKELYRQLTQQHPDFAPGHHNLGRSLEQEGNLAGAVAAYRRAVGADPSLASAQNSLALALESQGDRVAAEAGYRAALQARPGYALAHFNLADLLLSSGRSDEATVHYAAGLARRPNNIQARYNQAAALRATGREAEAAAELEIVLAARPEDPGTLHNLAWILATTTAPDLRDAERAVRLAELAARLTANRQPVILETLGVAYRAAGRRQAARDTLRQASALARAAGQMDLAQAIEQRLAGS